MNELCRKYNLSEESYRAMLRDGILSSTLEGWNQVYECYKKHLSLTGKQSEAVYEVCIELNVCRTKVYEVIARFR